MKRFPALAKLAALGLLSSLAVSSTAFAADGLDYNYVEGGYVSTHADGADADGWGINASAALSPNWSVFGSYSAQQTDPFYVGTSRIDTDVDQSRLGVGFNTPIASNTDLVARVAYDHYKIDPNGTGVYGSSDANGWDTEVGVRSALMPNLEGYALAGYEDGNDFDGEYYGRLGAQWKLNQNWGVSGDVKFADGDTQYFIGPRLSW
jgi:Ax21 family sulfation-dependent quorum factor